MKKALGFTLVLALVLMFSAAVFAAPAEEVISIKGGTVTVNVVDDFSAHSADYSNGEWWTFKFEDGKLKLEILKGIALVPADGSEKTSFDDASKALWSSAKYVGYQVKNNGEEVSLALLSQMGESNANINDANAELPIVLLSKKSGKVNAEETKVHDPWNGDRGYGAKIPANFDGWVFFPIERMNGAGTPFEDIQFDVEGPEGASLTVDNMALAENLDVTPSGSDEPTTTADVSTIAFAVVSVLGCGALVVRRKRS